MFIAQLDSFEKASSTTKTWGILVDTGAATSVAPKSFASDIELSPTPSTLQLTTATSKTVKTYGLKKVHLQSQGLSLEVTFVIADVVTPLLGLDSMIKDSLSLHVEHDLQQFLVNTAGDRTQLVHMGRHLCLIACPSQHGLSHCFPGSLSHVIGFLPADKELHEQELASRSSSSIDLDEDTSKQQVEQDSLTFQRQQVLRTAFDEKNDPILDLIPSKEEVATSGGKLPASSFHPHHYQQTKQSSTQERKLHNMTHIHLEHGCVVDQEAKCRASIKTSNIQLAYAYIRQSQDCEPTLILTWLESFTGLAGSLITTTKGPTTQQLDAVVTFISRQGLAHSTLQCDGEPALVKLVEEIGKQTGMPTRQSPASSHQLAAWQSRLFTKFRALLFDFSHRYKLQPSNVQIASSLGQYMLQHAVCLIGISFMKSHHVLPFGELVLAHDQNLAIWLGRCEASDEHILAKANSNSLVKSRIVTRLSLVSSMDPILFKSISLPQPELSSAAYLQMAKLGDQPKAKAGGERELRRVSPPQASKYLQPKAKGRQQKAPTRLPPGLAQPSSSQACPYELSDLAWQQPALQQPNELLPTALHPPVVQQPPTATTALIERVIAPTSSRQPSEEHASQQQPVRRSKKLKGSEEIANKLHSILEKARTLQEIELAINTSEEESRESQAAVKAAQLHADFEDDLSLFSAEEIKRTIFPRWSSQLESTNSRQQIPAADLRS